MGGIRILALGLATSLCVASVAWAAPWMTLTSTSIKDGARIPVRFGGDDPKRACSPRNPAICPCPGKNISPELAWHNAPDGTKSFAILMYDVDGQYGAGVSHWVAYNIAPTTTELKEGDATAGTGFTGGAGTRSNVSRPARWARRWKNSGGCRSRQSWGRCPAIAAPTTRAARRI